MCEVHDIDDASAHICDAGLSPLGSTGNPTCGEGKSLERTLGLHRLHKAGSGLGPSGGTRISDAHMSGSHAASGGQVQSHPISLAGLVQRLGCPSAHLHWLGWQLEEHGEDREACFTWIQVPHWQLRARSWQNRVSIQQSGHSVMVAQGRRIRAWAKGQSKPSLMQTCLNRISNPHGCPGLT